MENLKTFKGRTVIEGQMVEAFYRKDGLITLKDYKTKEVIGTCSSVTLKNSKIYNAGSMRIVGTISNHEMKCPIKIDYELMRSMYFPDHVIDKITYMRLSFQHQITAE